MVISVTVMYDWNSLVIVRVHMSNNFIFTDEKCLKVEQVTQLDRDTVLVALESMIGFVIIH